MKQILTITLLTVIGVALPVLFCGSLVAASMGTVLTYQGHLEQGQSPSSGPVTGVYDFQFSLWDALTNGNQVGVTQTVSAVSVSNGLFTVSLDFGAGAFNGDARWLEIGVRTNGGGAFTELAPRQETQLMPYALYSAEAGNTSATNLTGIVPDAQISSNVARLNGSATFAGAVTGASFVGNGFGLMNLQATNLVGTLPQESTVQIATNAPFTNAVLTSPDGTNRAWSAALNNIIANAAQCYVSTNIPLTTNGTYLYWTNQLTFAPSNSAAYYVCLNSDSGSGYQAGDIIGGNSIGSAGTAINAPLLAIYNGTNVSITSPIGGFLGNESTYYFIKPGSAANHPTSFTNFAARAVFWTPGANSILSPTNGMVGSDVTNAIDGLIQSSATNFGNTIPVTMTNAANQFIGAFAGNGGALTNLIATNVANMTVTNLSLVNPLSVTNLSSIGASAGQLIASDGAGNVIYSPLSTNTFASPPWYVFADSNYFVLTNELLLPVVESLSLPDGSFFVGKITSGKPYATNYSAAFNCGIATNHSFAVNEAVAGVIGNSGYDFACNNATAEGGFSFAGGQGSKTYAPNSFVFGQNNFDYDTVGGSAILGNIGVIGTNGADSIVIGNYGRIMTNNAILICEQLVSGQTNYSTTNAIPFSILLSSPNSVRFQSLTNNVQSLSPFLATVGVASSATNNATVGSSGWTNSLPIAMWVYGFTGTDVVQTNADGYGFSRGTISTPVDILLQPGAFLIGTLCSSQGVHAW